MRIKRFLAHGVALSVLACAMATGAAAQSTGTSQVDEVVVTGRSGPRTVTGAMVAETQPKNRSSVTQEFINRQQPGQTILQTLNLTPGLSFTNNDPYGSSGGNVRLHGQDGQHIGFLIDGVPLNDAGNYSIYSNQQLDPELIEQANVNTGSTDVDTVTAASTGGVIQYTTRKTAKQFGAFANLSYGSYDYKRVFGLIDTGPVGPLGTRAYVAGSYQQYDKFKGPGDLEKLQLNARIDQPIGDRGDFVSLLANYNENRNTFYYNPNLSNVQRTTVEEVSQFGWDLDYFDTFIPQTARAGVADTPAAQDTAVRGFYGARVNPSNTGTIRALSRFTILPNLHLTVDPSFNYTLANGGGAQSLVEATAPQILSPAGLGRDLNGDGDTLDTLSTFGPSNTNTRRYSVNSSLIWDITPDHLVRFAYAWDRAHTRQTGEYSYLTADGFPMDVFSAKDGHDATPIRNGVGSVAQRRDRDSIAQLNQYSVEYRGRFFDQRLVVTAGVRIPMLDRELNQFCYTQTGTSTVVCTVRNPATSVAVAGALANIVTFGTATTRYVAPFKGERSYDDVLPQAGATFRVTDALRVYANYSEQMAAPKVDNLYSVGAGGQLGTVEPETSQSIDYGVRYALRDLVAQVGGYHTTVSNRIVSTRDPTDDTIIDRNVGSVEINGVDGQVNFRPYGGPVALYGFASYTVAELQENLFVGGTAIYPNGGLPAGYVPTAGKQLVETPKYTYGGRVTAEFGPFLFGVQAKYTGRRFVTDVNDLSVPSFFVIDLDAQLKLDQIRKGTVLQFNVTNLLDDKHYGSLSGTQTSATTGAPGFGLPFAAVGAPFAAVLTLKAVF